MKISKHSSVKSVKVFSQTKAFPMLLCFLSLYILLLIALSTFHGRFSKSQSAAGFLTGNASAGALLCALSFVSTIIGGSATLGMGSLAQKIGAAAFWWLGVGAIGLFLHGCFVAPAIRRIGACTLPDVLGKLAGQSAKRWGAFIIVASWVGVLAAQFSALRTLLTDVLPGNQAEVFFLLIAVVIILHTALGGQKAVIRTDALQTTLLVVGFVSALVWCSLSSEVKPAQIDPVPFNAAFGFFDWLKLSLLVGLTYVIGPDIFSRTFAAKSDQSASRGAWLGSLLLFFFAIAITFLALMNLSADNPISGWLDEHSAMPSAIKVALTLGLVSALAGSADTVLLSAAGIVEKDILNGDQSSRLRKLVAVFGFFALLLTYQSADIIGWLLYAYALFVPGVAAPLLVLLIRKQSSVNTKILMCGAFCGGVLGFLGNLTGLPLAVPGVLVSAVFSWFSVNASETRRNVVPD